MKTATRLNSITTARDRIWNKTLLAIGLLFIALCVLAPTGPVLAQGKDHVTQKDKKWNQRREERLIDYKDEKGKVRPDLWEKGVEHYQEMEYAAGVARISNGAPVGAPAAGVGLQGVQWIQVGPQPAFPIEGVSFQGDGAMSGEVLDIAIDPSNLADDVIYSVTNDGGVWKSTDGGVTFQPKTDNMPSLSMGAIVLDPVNPQIVYAGTGNLYDGNGGTTTLAVKAVGIYRSIDMGESWSVLNPGGIFTGRGISRMAMPAADVLLVGTTVGLFKSVNGGVTFGQPPTYDNGLPVLAGFVEDIDKDATSPSTTIYASVNGGGIFVSTDAGDTFPTNLFTSTNGSPDDTAGVNGRYAMVAMAQGVSDPARLYATVQEDGSNPPPVDADGYAGLYRSDDTGATWTRMAGADAPGADNGGCQCGYDQTIGVDPRDEDLVYIGFQELYYSGDGGGSFGIPAISRNKIHWDHHFIGWSPPTHWGGLGGGDSTPMWVGTDGGVHSSDDGGTTFNNFHNATIASNLFHHMDIGRGSAANNDWTYGGTQDTGTLHSCAPGNCDPLGALATGGPFPWEMGTNGDGSGIAVDPTNPLRAYGVRNGGYRFTDDGGQTWQAPGAPAPTSAWRYAIDSNDTSRVWAATGGTFSPTATLFRSDDNTGLNWTQLNTFGTNIRDLAVTPADSNVLWLGMTDGSLRKSVDATAAVPTFATINVPGNPGSSVSEVAINPLNRDEVVVTYRGICGGPCSNADNRMKRIFMTTNGGTNWADISGTDGNPVGNLPNLPTHDVVFDIGTSPISIVVSNDVGVLRSSNNGQTWEKLGLGLPTADSKMLQIDDAVEPPLLRLGTYGRSIWELAEAQGPILAVNADLGFDTVCTGESQTRVVQLFNVGSDTLIVNAIFRESGSTQIVVLAAPSTPFQILPGEEVDFTVKFLATAPGDHTAIIQINSNDQFDQSFQIAASGTVNTQMIATVIADSGDFGNVCSTNDFHDLDLIIANPGCGALSVSGISILGADNADFQLAGVLDFPLNVAEGNSIHVPVRFNPSGACGDTRTATVRIASDDPATPNKDVPVEGTVPCPDINVAIANSGDFGNVCATEQKDLNLTLFNQGQCDLTISSIASSDTDLFELPADTKYPLVLSHDADFTLPVRFSPDACTLEPPETGTVTINSDDPDDSPWAIDLSGAVPCPNLVIDAAPLSGLYAFPATVVDSTDTLGCYSDRSTNLRNTGLCPLTIDDIAATGADFEVIDPTQFPIVLPPGEETLGVTVRFTPVSGGDPLAPDEVLGELTVTSDDPDAAGEAELCGEGVVQSGIRTLVTDISSGIPLLVSSVDSMTVRTKGKNTPGPINLMFSDQPVSGPISVCGKDVSWHLNLETLPATQTTGQNGASQYEVYAKDGNLQDTRTFGLGQCEFVEFQMELKSSTAEVCLLAPKGASCTSAAQCCSGKCSGKTGSKTCK
ncbi:MAG TPA: choice-of-anchor D domain-containing protein [Xanthomonadales bacterium]|nr:choice-of-anchor D domain-containing protein [Xanthomonadales bacterium]